MKYQLRICIKLIIFISCFSTIILTAQEKEPISSKFLYKLQIPDDIGIIKEIFIPEHETINEVIFYIQDAHCNYEAQMNISKIVKLLVDDYNVSLINVEGTAGIIDTKPFSTFKDRKVKLEFADYFIKQGKITGPEYLSITSDLEFTLFGIEDEELYAENYTAYMNCLEYKERVNAYTIKFLERLNSLKEHMFSEKLLLLDKESRKYQDKTLEFADYTSYLEKFALEMNVDLSKFKNFILQAEARKIENSIDFKKIEEQRSKLISIFHEILKGDKKAIKEIVKKSLSFRMKDIRAEDYYNFLVETAKKYDLDRDDYTLIEQYAKYLKLYYAIDKSLILDEISDVELFIKKKLYQNEEEAQLDSLSRIMGILNRLFKLEVIKSDYLYFKNNKDKFTFREVKKFVLTYGPKYNIYLGFDVDFQLIESNIHWVLDFYEAAIKRDVVLIDNSLSRMSQDKVDRCILVTGGFHSDGLTRILKEKNISYILIAPRILNPLAQTTYEEVMKAQADSVKGYKGLSH